MGSVGRAVDCPKCKSDNVVNIIYGEPSPSLLKKSQDGEVELGGCIIDSDSPRYKCKSCINEFGFLKDSKMKILLKILKWLFILFIILVVLFALLTRSGISPYRCDRITDTYPTLGWILCGDNYYENAEKYWYSNENE